MKYKIKPQTLILKSHCFNYNNWYEGKRISDRKLNVGYYLKLISGEEIEGFYSNELISEKEDHTQEFNNEMDKILK